MPAVTADPITLPRLHAAPADAQIRAVQSLTTAPQGFEGEGFPVRRAFAGATFAALDPFIHMDQMGPIDYPPYEPKGTPWHPHRGFETVTYMIDGAMQHQDSHGGGGLISDGATQWMTAGAGILHIETPPEALVISGGRFHGIQLWVNLPGRDKMIAPAYQSLEPDEVTLVASPDGGALVRIVAGDVGGHGGPGATHTPIAFLHVTVAPGAQVDLPWRPDFNGLVYVLSGSGSTGPDATDVSEAQLAVLGAGEHIRLAGPPAGVEPLEALVLGGQPIREPVAAHGPFVMNTRDQLITAFDDFDAGRLGVVPPGALQPYRRPAGR